ncbi:PEP-CTERM sorting domain-containing protein [Bryobacter aggregatus]|uniref:PEP-CTERM sorting domain-containing protein n=1 Tax=Bryobacter aggregatus TaxID=360054 RepID=UPI0004E261C1|nr:PEP-CTERM sorting domain-containing protein [Bryobacter aggregatus]
MKKLIQLSLVGSSALASTISYSGVQNLSITVASNGETFQAMDVDFDGDGTIDMIFRVGAGDSDPSAEWDGRSSARIFLQNGTGVAGGDGNVQPLLIGDSTEWLPWVAQEFNEQMLLSLGKDGSGNFPNGEDRYLAFTLKKDNDVLKGWALVNVSLDFTSFNATQVPYAVNRATLTLQEWAYSCAANENIEMGDKGGATGASGCGVENVPEPSTFGLLALGAAGLGILKRRKA